jgi:hypothetical protein
MCSPLRETVSMMDALLFDKLVSSNNTVVHFLTLTIPYLRLIKEFIAREVRESQRPFGGIQVSCNLPAADKTLMLFQLVLCGDFFQLPPVPDKSHQYSMASTYVFDAKSWPQCISRPTFLNQVFRQKNNSKHLVLMEYFGMYI